MIYVGRVKDEYADENLITEFGLQNAKYFPNIKILSWECEEGDSALTNIKNSNKLQYCYEDTEYKATFYSVEEEGPAGDQSEIPEETIETYHTTQSTSYGASNYWQLEQIQKRDLTTTNYHNYVYDEDGTNVDVYVVDTGINHSHLHLGDATRSFEMPSSHYNPVTYGYANNNDDHSHGTYCSLCVGGRHDNSQGGGYGPGVAKGVQFYALKVLNSAGSGSGVTIAAAINGVISHHNAKTATATMYVRVAGGKYYINDVLTKSFNLFPGMTYKFHQEDGTNANHPLRFSTTVDGTFGGGVDYTTGVITSGTPGSSGAYTQIAVTSSTAATLYYFCDHHSGYGTGGTVTVKTAHATINKKPSIINISIGHGIPTTAAKYINVDTAGTASGDIIEDALKTATMAGVHVVNSAGNGYDNNDGNTVGPLKTEYNIGTIGLAYPEESNNTDAGQGLPIIVGATTDNTGSGSGNTAYGTGYNNNINPTTGRNHAAHTATAMAYFSNYGRANTINAPGRYVKVPHWNTFTSGNSWPISSISGTSFSCPITAGLVAQYVGLHPEVSPLEVKDWIKTVASTDVNGTGITDIETEITLQANPITTVGGSGTHPGTGTNTAQLMLLPNHGLITGDYLQLRGVVGAGGNLGGVPQNSFNGWHKVVNVVGDVVDITLLDISGNPVVPTSAETSGGTVVKFLALMQSGADTHDYTEGVIWEADNLELKTNWGWPTGVYWPEIGNGTYQQGVCPPGIFIYPTPNRHLFTPYQEYITTWTEGNTTTGTFGLTAVTEGASVSVDLSATMATGHNSERPFTETYSVIAGSLPAGLTLNVGNGLLSGTAPSLTENASYEWSIQITNGYGTEIKKYQMTVLESTTPTPVVSSVGGISVANGITVSIT